VLRAFRLSRAIYNCGLLLKTDSFSTDPAWINSRARGYVYFTRVYRASSRVPLHISASDHASDLDRAIHANVQTPVNVYIALNAIYGNPYFRSTNCFGKLKRVYRETTHELTLDPKESIVNGIYEACCGSSLKCTNYTQITQIKEKRARKILSRRATRWIRAAPLITLRHA